MILPVYNSWTVKRKAHHEIVEPEKQSEDEWPHSLSPIPEHRKHYGPFVSASTTTNKHSH